MIIWNLNWRQCSRTWATSATLSQAQARYPPKLPTQWSTLSYISTICNKHRQVGWTRYPQPQTPSSLTWSTTQGTSWDLTLHPSKSHLNRSLILQPISQRQCQRYASRISKFSMRRGSSTWSPNWVPSIWRWQQTRLLTQWRRTLSLKTSFWIE